MFLVSLKSNIKPIETQSLSLTAICLRMAGSGVEVKHGFLHAVERRRERDGIRSELIRLQVLINMQFFHLNSFGHQI